MPACCRTQQTNRSSSQAEKEGVQDPTQQTNRSSIQAEKESEDPNGQRHVIFLFTAATCIIVIVCIVAGYGRRRLGPKQNEQNQELEQMESRSAEVQSSISADEDSNLTAAEDKLNN